MNLRRLVNSPTGRIIISIVLGLGLASLFYKVCKDKDCIHFSGPIIKQVDGKIFQYDHKCFKYDAVPVTCNDKKKNVSFTEGAVGSKDTCPNGGGAGSGTGQWDSQQPPSVVNPCSSSSTGGSSNSNTGSSSTGTSGSGSGTWNGTTGEMRNCPCPLTVKSYVTKRGTRYTVSECICCPQFTSGRLSNSKWSCNAMGSSSDIKCTKCCDGVFYIGDCVSKQAGWDSTNYRWEDCPCGLNIFGRCGCCKFGTIVGDGGKKDKCCNGPTTGHCG